MHRRDLVRGAIAAGTLAFGGAPARSQGTWPTRPVRIVIGFAPGSGTDVTARLIAQELQKDLGQSFVVENRPGAAVQIAANLVKGSAPDGYTFLLTSNSSHSVNPHVFKKITYDPIADFTPIGGVASLPFIVAVNADLPVRTLPELVAWGQAERGKSLYAYSGTVFRVVCETLNRAGRLESTGVSFKSSPEAMTEVVAGRVHYMVVDLASSQPHLQSKRLRPLAVTTGRRTALAPDLPTVMEAMKVDDFDIAAWTGLFGPANVPQPIVEKLAGTLQAILARPEVQQRMLASFLDPMPMTPPVFADYVKQQLVTWGRKVKEAGIEPE